MDVDILRFEAIQPLVLEASIHKSVKHYQPLQTLPNEPVSHQEQDAA